MNVYFTSDTHAYHTNICKYAKRPFKDVEEMNGVLAANINRVVMPNNFLYHLGDWSFGGADRILQFRNMINCQNVVLILGNHDKDIKYDIEYYTKTKHCFKSIHTLLETKLHGQDITLCHYAMRVWNKSHYGAWHLYGHSHGSLPDDPHALSFDCGVDCHHYKPLSFEEVRHVMKQKQWKPVDRHEPRKR